MLGAINTKQITNHILMVRPAHFNFNVETASSNPFQHNDNNEDSEVIQSQANYEFDETVRKLRDHRIHVKIIDDTDDPVKTDAVFPNNWITFHENGALITYPMFSKNRRAERREDIITEIENEYIVHKRYSFEYYEQKNKFLEGTGSMVLDRINKIVYASLSPRTDAQLLEKFAVLNGYSKQVFHATDHKGQAIYHTNVMMSLGLDFVVICLESIHQEEERVSLISRLEKTGKELIVITMDQMYSFAGNMLQLEAEDGSPLLVMSEQAFKSLTPEQVMKIHDLTEILYCSIPTIEKYGGGSVRCMISEIFLKPKVQPAN